MAKCNQIELLGPSIRIKELENYAARLKRVMGFKKIALSKAVAGRLRISTAHGSCQFYHVLGKSGGNGKYIPGENNKLVKQLAQKSYDRRVLAKMTKLEKLIRNFCTNYKALVPELVFERMNKDRKPFVEPVILPDERYAEFWSSEEYKGKDFWVGDPEYFTARGLRVRSKSEILIADTLDRYGIPYRYEYGVELRRFGTVHPDFYVLRVADRKEFCWEHFGMMDDPEYAQKAVRKIAAYAESGWFPGENMIVSFESMDCPLEEKQIERLVEGLLL